MSSATDDDDEQRARADEPWLARPDWAAGHILPKGGSWWAIVIIASVWNAACLVVGFLAFPHLRERIASGEYLFLLLLIFPLLGLGLLINAVRSVVNARRLGRMWLELKTVPASVGQFLGGVIHSDKEMNLKEGVRLTLTCLKETLSTGRNSKGQAITQLTDTPEWSETQVLDRELLEEDRTRTVLPVYFRIPRDAPATKPRVGEQGYHWQLEVAFEKAVRANLLSSVTFEVPVFETAASQQPFSGPAAAADPLAEFKSDQPLRETPEAQGVRIAPSRRGGTVFTFQAPDVVRGTGCSVALVVMMLLAAGVTWHLWRPEQAIGGAWAAGFVFLLLALAFSYIRWGVNRLTLDIGEAEYEHTLFGLGVRKKFDPALIASVQPERDTREAREILWDLPLVLLEQKPNGLAYKKRHTLVRGLPKETADTVASQIAQALTRAVAGKKREFRVASGADPAIALRAMRATRWITRGVSVFSAAALAFLAWQMLYVQFAEVRQTEPFRFGMMTLQTSALGRETLGEPMKAGWFVTGPIDDRHADLGWASLSIPVSGSLAAGTLHVDAQKSDGRWQYNRLALRVKDAAEEIDLLPPTDAPPE
ncbi:MAG: hypothetical protein H0V56_05255 [Chthoniobacterales bacterium]|nr:hypothetical protein [Chthoniobacterales bacterium]